MDFGRIFLKAVHQNCWVKIKYKNKSEEETEFMVGINRIYPEKRSFKCDVFNIDKTENDYYIYLDGVTDAELCEDTYHKTPDGLLKFISENPTCVSFLKMDVSKDDLIDYYINCFKLDTTPYVAKYGLVEGIDDDVIMEHESFPLTDDQFKSLAKGTFYKKENKKKREEEGHNQEKKEKFLVLNELSIKTNKGLYVLASRDLKLDVLNKALVPADEITVHKEFQYDSSLKEVKETESIYRYIPEENYELLDDFALNKDKIIEVIHSYYNTRTSTYKSELKLDSRPFIICLERMYSVDIEGELNKIKSLAKNPEEVPLPLKTFFGDSESRLARRMNYPIFTTDGRYNIDQINAINIGFKSTSSYIQGPPGTGKTQTLLNSLVTAVLNNQTVLVTSNNNIPMDGIYEDILKLKYKDKEELLFPAIRLGSTANIEAALLRIKSLYERSKTLKPDPDRIKSLKSKRKNAMKSLVDLLDKYDKYTSLKEKRESLEACKKDSTNPAFSLLIDAEMEKLDHELKDIGEVNLEDLKKYMDIDFRELYMAIHFETAGRLQNLSRPKYKELFQIINDTNETNTKSQASSLKKYLRMPENLKNFLEIFPIIISTNLSCTYLGECGNTFDIVMMDEAGQCAISNALIPVSRATKLMLVGDPQQLKPVIVLDKKLNEKLRDKYHIPEEYDYVSNSIYTAYTQVDVVNNETMLRCHYRCNDKIIGFSNKKYYNNKLKLMAESKEEEPLVFYDTSHLDKNSSDVKNISEAEVTTIISYIKNHPDEKVGIITPFVHQKDCIERCFEDKGIKNITVGTVHAFQGDQRNTIIFSSAVSKCTGASTYNWLKNNKELINVAISRAKDKFIMLGNKTAIKNLSDGTDDFYELSEYVSTKGVSKVTNVAPESYALGTRHISTQSEKDLSETIKQILSVVNNNCYIRNEVAVASIFEDDGSIPSLFYMQRFDIVLFERTYSEDRILLAVEENGPEHYTSEEVRIRDEQKKKFCEAHNLKLLTIPRDCARDYGMIKNALLDIIKVKK